MPRLRRSAVLLIIFAYKIGSHTGEKLSLAGITCREREEHMRLDKFLADMSIGTRKELKAKI